MVLAFFAISLYSGIAAYANFQLSNSTDAGIILQAVASTAHGHVAPFYESYDCMVKSRCSFLLVHPAIILYVAVPFYTLAPSIITLFALQSTVVAAAAIPLYWLTRQVTGSSGKGLLAAGMFLVWAPTLAADAFSLHLECLLPLELISLAALWQSGRYRLGLAVAFVAFLTFEITPIFTFLIGVFFLFPYVERFFRIQWRRWRSGSRDKTPVRSEIFRWLNDGRQGLRLREVRYLLVLMVGSAAAYVALSLFMNVWGYGILGVGSPSEIAGIFYNNSTPATQSVGTILHSSQTVSTGEYWLLLYGLLAFIPLLSPRALILSVPWIGWTFLTDSSYFTTIGHEHAMVAAGPLFIGLAYGFGRIRVGRPSPGPEEKGVTAAREPAAAPYAVPIARLRIRSVKAGWAVGLTIVVVANALLMPINPVLSDLGGAPGAPFAPNYFDHSLEISPAFAWAEQLVSIVPYNATVAGIYSYFPLLANYPHAYVIVHPVQMHTSNLPFNVSRGPQYVLVTAPLIGFLTGNLSRSVSDPLLYGMRGYVGLAAQGPLLLYERGFAGPAEVFGPGLPRTAATYLPSSGLDSGPKGVEATDPSSPSGVVITSLGGTNRTGLVWTGPDALFAPGNYSLNVEVVVTGANLTLHPDQAALRVNVAGFGGTPVNQTFDASRFVSGEWTNLSFNLSLANPLPEMNIDGYLDSVQLSVAVASVSLEPAGP